MDLPTDPRKIAERIRRYERALRRDLETIGSIDDGAGKRYLLGALYLALGDVQGALESYAWLQKVVPDDSGEPVDYLCWTLALYRAGDRPAASRKLVQTMLRNLYLIPALIGVAQPRLDIWHGSNWAEPEYAEYGVAEVATLWDADALAWARRDWESAAVQRVRERYLQLWRQLSHEPVGPTRSRLVRAMARMRSG